MFPNRLGIYLHDTPQRESLSQDMRYVSNGCVRVERADALTRFLAAPGTDLGTPGEPTRRIALPRPVPVFIMHLTFWPEGGEPAFHPDVYRRDPAMLARMGWPS